MTAKIKTFDLTIKLAGTKGKFLTTQVHACDIRFAIEGAHKEMKENFSTFVENVDYSIVKIRELYIDRK